MRGLSVFAFAVVIFMAKSTYAGSEENAPPLSFDEVRSCLKDLSRINAENNKSGEILMEALYQNLYRALACVEVLSGLEEMELTASQEGELQDWQATMEKEEGATEDLEVTDEPAK